MNNKELNEAIMRADLEYDMLKDKLHDQYEEIQKLKSRIRNAIEFLEIIQYNEAYGKKYIDYNELKEILEGEEKTQEEYRLTKDPSGTTIINGEAYKVERIS